LKKKIWGVKNKFLRVDFKKIKKFWGKIEKKTFGGVKNEFLRVYFKNYKKNFKILEGHRPPRGHVAPPLILVFSNLF
jgi:hypothetical protein